MEPGTVCYESAEFAARSQDIGANKAFLVCAGGFSAGAVRLAKDRGMDILRINQKTGKLESEINSLSSARELTLGD